MLGTELTDKINDTAVIGLTDVGLHLDPEIKDNGWPTVQQTGTEYSFLFLMLAYPIVFRFLNISINMNYYYDLA